jgi:hypothetical protein
VAELILLLEQFNCFNHSTFSVINEHQSAN